mmetsp:Transcript_11645/g.33913  ORF Transcript_11645/g.33913 Transcript_11645/m.33913 type:complete len:220 (-) Transcript_11645:302-961(-)
MNDVGGHLLVHYLVEQRSGCLILEPSAQNSGPATLLRPTLEDAGDLVKDTLRRGLVGLHPLEPPRQLGRQHISRLPPELFGQYVGDEDHCGEEGRVCQRDLTAGDVGPVGGHTRLHRLQLTLQLTQRRLPVVERPEGRCGLVHGALDGADVDVVQPAHDVAPQLSSGVSRHKRHTHTLVLIDKVSCNRIRFRYRETAVCHVGWHLALKDTHNRKSRPVG